MGRTNSYREEVTKKRRRIHHGELYDLVLLTEYFVSDQNKNTNIDGNRGTYVGHERCLLSFDWKT